MPLTQTTSDLKKNHCLTAQQMEACFQKIFLSDVPDHEIREFLVALYEKGETVDEIFGAASFLKQHAKLVRPQSQNLFDCCGTGGDAKGMFNVSTAAAFVLAGGGVKVAKHGNRAVSSKSGSADVLEALGISINLTGEQSAHCVDTVGIGFFFAPTHYPFLRRVGAIRKSIPHRTIFNLLGPLLNPAGATRQLLGVADPSFVAVHAEVLQRLGAESAIVVSSEDGADEFTLTAKARMAVLSGGQITESIFDPWEPTGYAQCTQADLMGGDAAQNALRLKLCLKGHSQPIDHVVHINAAWGFVAAGLAADFMEGLLLAQQSVSSGRAYQKLEELVDGTNP